MINFALPTLVTITAPTCAGKNFLLEALVDEFGFDRIVSTTDRAPRDGEIEGVHYFFIDTETSKRLEADGKFAELVTYNGTRYGVTHVEMARKMLRPSPPMVILEPSGLKQYQAYCNAKGWKLFNIYVETPEAIRLERLVGRTATDILRGLDKATDDFQRADVVFKNVRVNNQRLKAVLEQERMWSHQNRWDVLADGTNKTKALEQIMQGIKYRNSRTEMYA